MGPWLVEQALGQEDVCPYCRVPRHYHDEASGLPEVQALLARRAKVQTQVRCTRLYFDVVTKLLLFLVYLVLY